MTTNSFPAAPICHEQNVCVPCAMGVAEESNIEVSRKKHGQEEANKSEIKDSEQWRCSFEVLHVSDDSGDQNCRKAKAAEPVQALEWAMQVIRRDRHSQSLERSQDPAVSAEISDDLLVAIGRHSAYGYCGERVDAGVLSSVMKCLPGPVGEEYVSLDHRASKCEKNSGDWRCSSGRRFESTHSFCWRSILKRTNERYRRKQSVSGASGD